MAREAKLLARLDQHFGIRRAMRVVTRITFAVLDRLVFYFGGGNELSKFLVLMAIGANFQEGAAHFD